MQKCTCRFSEPLDLCHPATVNAPDRLERNGQGRTQAYADKTHQHLSCVPPVPRELPPDDATDDMPLPPRAPLPAEAPEGAWLEQSRTKNLAPTPPEA